MRRPLTALAAVVVVVLGVAQLVLPGIAAQRLRDQLARSGQVLSIHVSAFPAIELLWHHADSVVVRMGSYSSASATHLGSTLHQSGDVGSLTASAREVRVGRLTLHDASVVKRGNQLSGRAVVTEADLRTALPILRSVTPVASGNGQLTVRGTASVFGVTAGVDATVSVRDGAVVVAPDIPFGGLAAISVFSDPRISVRSVGANTVPGGFAVRGTAVLR
jgi:hypothetical protein